MCGLLFSLCGADGTRLEKFYDAPVPVSVLDKFKMAMIEDSTDNITEEEMQNIAESVYFDHIRNKEIRKIRSNK